MTPEIYDDLFEDDLDPVAIPLSAAGASVIVVKFATVVAPTPTSDLRSLPLRGFNRVGPVGLEPTTHGLKVRCSTN